MEILLLYNYIVAGALVVILGNFLLNNYIFRDTSSYCLADLNTNIYPLVSVLIPARNEEKNIARCLRSLTRQDYPNLEILVLDDNSNDNTNAVVQEYVSRYRNVRLINGKPLPAGWLGKSYACHQLAAEAGGDFLVFTDADTLHFKNSISGAVSALTCCKHDAISVFARQITVSIHERMMVPFANYFLMAFMPFILILKFKNPLFCTAIGQFLMFKRGVYESIGGHEAIKSEILDDIQISKLVKRHGFSFMIFDGRNNFYCRMYKNLDEVIKGYTKVLSAVFDYSIFMQTLVTFVVFAVFLCPFIALPLAILIFNWPNIMISLLIFQILVILSIKVILTIRFKNRFMDIFLFPLSVIYLLLISVNALLKSKSAKGIYWKGRTYDVRKEDKLTIIKDEQGKIYRNQ
jgi:chlorobactene glucosyltransferase